MNQAARLHQARALAEAQMLDAIPHAPRPIRRVQAQRVFAELRAMLAAPDAAPPPPARRPRTPWWA